MLSPAQPGHPAGPRPWLMGTSPRAQEGPPAGLITALVTAAIGKLGAAGAGPALLTLVSSSDPQGHWHPDVSGKHAQMPFPLASKNGCSMSRQARKRRGGSLRTE